MSQYKATHKTSGEVVEYDADMPQPEHLTDDWRLEEISIAAVAPDVAEQPAIPLTVYGGRRRLTKQEFLDLLGDAAVTFILAAAKSDIEVEKWIKRLDLTTPDPDGTSIDLDDHRTVAGVTTIGSAMVSLGVVTAEWAQGVLNG